MLAPQRDNKEGETTAMAARTRREFVYRNIELYKEDTLGTGSYGGVCKAKCDGLPCAAKIMHPTLFDLRDPGTISYLRKFEEECQLLSLARHPNVVQYLATYRDPDTRLPVLIMELCDESLCRFLERSPGVLPYHTQLNISHDITLALVYLHSNGLTHRDLTGNNVLMIAGVRAKVTDFGMSKLASVNPRMTPMSLCPGNVQYMSPEALEEPPSYTNKLDMFSFGVLVVQIMTRQFPNPGPRFQVLDVPDDPRFPEGTVRVAIPETQRRRAHLKLIADTHSLKVIAIGCLKSKERERPSAQQLSNTVSELKQAPKYTESLQQVQTAVGGGREVDSLKGQVRDLQQQIQTQQQDIEQQQGENEQLQTEHNGLVAQNQQLGHQLQGRRVLTEAKMREVQQLQRTVQEKERELGQTTEASEHLVEQLQQNLQQKDRTISDLRQTISAHERKLQQLEQQDKHAGGQHLQPSAAAKVPQAAVVPAVQRNITRLRWEEGKRAPQTLSRGSALVDGNIVHFSPYGSREVYSCHVISGEQQWSTLARNPYCCFSLVLINGLLTSVGGYGCGSGLYNNYLLSLTGDEGRKRWCEVFPAMPTRRSDTASVTTEQTLIVAGGYCEGRRLDIVEVMDIPSQQWTTASRLPHPFHSISGTVCGGQFYMAGGLNESGKASKSVLTCSLDNLLSPQSLGTRLRTLFRVAIWRQAKQLPVIRSTLTTLNGHLLAIGGEDDSDEYIAAVHCYDTRTNSWNVVSQMKDVRSDCLAAALPEDRLLVVGGNTAGGYTDSLEIGRFP